MADLACAVLPSSEAACRLVRGDASALPKVIGTMALRAGLIALGVLAVGQREHVVRSAVGGSIAIEAFVLGWALVHRAPASEEVRV